jgi:thioesterase domain-containing protein/acyl carrier protein
MSTARYVAPRNAIEHQLAQMWEDLLERHPIGVEENFFEAGGDSILAMSLLARIAQELGCNLPPAGILQAATIEKLAVALRQEARPEDWSPLVPIRAEGAKPPFFCVHPGGGNVLCYLQLAKQIGADRPFFGLQCPGVDGILPPLAEAEQMARLYVEAIRQVQPRGPYALGGWSVGGVFAYEMAQQLRAAGEQVRLLAMLDSGVLYACALMTAIFPKGETGILDVVRMASAEQVREFRRRSAPARLIPDDADDELALRLFRLFATNMRAVLEYQARSYAGPLELFQAAESLVKPRFEPRHELARLCDHVTVHFVPGNHLTLIHEPHVQALGKLLRERLDVTDVS